MEFLRINTPGITTNIRVLHGLPKGPNVDVYSDGNLITRDLSFGSISSYINLSAGNHEIQLYKSGLYDKPLVTQTIQLAPGGNYTISLVTLSDDLLLFKLRDAGILTNSDSTYLRFINLSKNSPLLTLSLPTGSEIFNEVEYLETTGYHATSPGIYNFKVIFSGASAIYKNIKNLSLDSSSLYTIYIIGLFKETPQIGYLFVKDER